MTATTTKLGATMTENQIDTLTRLAIILEAGQAENGIDLARQATYAEALRAILARQPAAIGKDAVKPTCPHCGLPDIEYLRLCHNSSCVAYAKEESFYQGWGPAAPSAEQDERGGWDGDSEESRTAFRDCDSTAEPISLKTPWQIWRAACAWQARAASTSVNVAQAGHTVVPIEPTVAMVDALWDALPKGFTFNNCTPIGVVASIIAAAPSQSANVAQGAEAARQIEQYVLSVLPSVYYMDPPDGGSVSVLEQLRRMADDAAKYRASTAQPELAYGAEALRERIARALHYPACWDTAAYPTLESAVWEAIACAKLGCSKCEPAQPALTDDARDAFIRDVAAQKPEKPDHWSSCGQCGHNIERAQDLLDAAQSASGDTQ